MNSTITPFARPLYISVKPTGALCNLRCSYCYYLDKKNLYPDKKDFLLSDNLLEDFTKQYLQSQTLEEVMFTWHGGEPLLRGIDFYKKAIKLQKKYGRQLRIANSIQTNGTLLTDEWCRFLKENNFLIGISIDGTENQHNIYRRSAGGKPTFAKVVNGIDLLKKHRNDYNIMAVVHNYNVDYPLDFYNFFKNTDSRFIQFSPVVEISTEGKLIPQSVDSEKWGDFLIAIFNEWVRKDVGIFYIQYFDSALANWIGVPPGVCIFAETCGHAGAMEFNGDVYSCDHFVFPEYKLGNIRKQTLTGMMYSDKQFDFGASKRDALPSKCKNCKFLFACRGECPKNRIIKTETQESGLNYLCSGYYKFFKHIAPYMDFMKAELEAERPPSNIMYALKNGLTIND
jgi:uncharacterized protein